MAGAKGVKNSFALFWANASYKSFAKPYVRESDAGETSLDEPGLPLSNYPTSAASQHSNENAPPAYLPDKRVPSSKLTGHQLLYIAGSHGVGAFVLSGGINFAIAYGMLAIH